MAHQKRASISSNGAPTPVSPQQPQIPIDNDLIQSSTEGALFQPLESGFFGDILADLPPDGDDRLISPAHSDFFPDVDLDIHAATDELYEFDTRIPSAPTATNITLFPLADDISREDDLLDPATQLGTPVSLALGIRENNLLLHDSTALVSQLI